MRRGTPATPPPAPRPPPPTPRRPRPPRAAPATPGSIAALPPAASRNAPLTGALRQPDDLELGDAAGLGAIDLAGPLTSSAMRWRLASPAVGGEPSARYNAALVYDAARGRVVMFGGNDNLSNSGNCDLSGSK